MDSVLTSLGRSLGRLAGLAAAGGYLVRRGPAEQTEGSLRLRGLASTVEVLRDEGGVPHIYAGTETDVFFAQGFVHAQDRLWQMDFNRRVASGTLAEVLGRTALPLDRWMRIIGLRRSAELEQGTLPRDVRRLVEAYAAGVNARIRQGRFPMEFRLLRYQPEPWTTTDSMAWAKMMAWWLSVNWSTEVLRERLVALLGPEVAAELEPRCRHREGSSAEVLRPAVRPEQAAVSGRTGPAGVGAPPSDPNGPAIPGGSGSNNWVIGGSRTASGAPLLANDMHLSLSTPSIWYENHLSGGRLEVAGVSFPGVPLVVAGHNRGVAWGFTAGLVDVQDLFREHLRPTADGGVEQEYQGGWHRAEVVRERIRVKDGETVTEEVVVTRHGPVVNGLARDFLGDEPLALRWTALEPERTLSALLDMNLARDCREFREALRNWGTPAQNVVYADTKGNIAYALAGKVPLRAAGDGRTPVPGWTDTYEWRGFVPFEEMPHRENPAEGFIATANDEVWGAEYPHVLGYDHCADHRVRRIRELIEEVETIDPAYVQHMQFDQVSTFARAVAGSLGGIETDDTELAQVLRRLSVWDGRLAADSPEAAMYQQFRKELADLLLLPKLGGLAARYLGEGPVPLIAGLTMFGERAMEWLEETVKKPQSHWFDLGSGESREEVILLALRRAVDVLKRSSGRSLDAWSWGALHRIKFPHSLGQVKLLDRLLSRGPYPVGGDFTTIWATGTSYQDFSVESVIAGPPFRFIADLSDLDHCLGLLAPGQSGHLRSRHYDDQIDAWFKRGYHPMLFTPAEVEEHTEERLHLEP